MELPKLHKLYPVGTKVKYHPIAGEKEYIETAIRSEFWTLGHGAIVVKVDGKTGCVSAEHIELSEFLD